MSTYVDANTNSQSATGGTRPSSRKVPDAAPPTAAMLGGYSVVGRGLMGRVKINAEPLEFSRTTRDCETHLSFLCLRVVATLAWSGYCVWLAMVTPYCHGDRFLLIGRGFSQTSGQCIRPITGKKKSLNIERFIISAPSPHATTRGRHGAREPHLTGRLCLRFLRFFF